MPLDYHLRFAQIAISDAEKSLAGMHTTPPLVVPSHLRTYCLCNALRWQKVAKFNVAQAEAMLERSRTLKPLRARSVKAKGGRA
jgi:hypothetical protein